MVAVHISQLVLKVKRINANYFWPQKSPRAGPPTQKLNINAQASISRNRQVSFAPPSLTATSKVIISLVLVKTLHDWSSLQQKVHGLHYCLKCINIIYFPKIYGTMCLHSQLPDLRHADTVMIDNASQPEKSRKMTRGKSYVNRPSAVQASEEDVVSCDLCFHPNVSLL